MSEVQSRPAAPRGRGSGRGGRGGFATRGGGRAGARPAANGDSKHDTNSSLPTLDDEGEVGQLKQQYGTKVEVIKEMFPDWSEVDILFALRETDGDENLTVTRIAEGKLSDWPPVFLWSRGCSHSASHHTSHRVPLRPRRLQTFTCCPVGKQSTDS